MMLSPSYAMTFSCRLFFKRKHCGMRYNRDEGLKKWGVWPFFWLKISKTTCSLS